jgi:hypothetical protein
MRGRAHMHGEGLREGRSTNVRRRGGANRLDIGWGDLI